MEFDPLIIITQTNNNLLLVLMQFEAHSFEWILENAIFCRVAIENGSD